MYQQSERPYSFCQSAGVLYDGVLSLWVSLSTSSFNLSKEDFIVAMHVVFPWSFI